LVDFEAQIEIWTNIFETELKLFEKGGYSNASLFLSAPPNNPETIKKDTSQIVFETYGFGEYCCTNSVQWNLLQYSSANPHSNIAKSQSALIVDSGFSFTHALPGFKMVN
jgi:actin-related protein 6